jgi:predicted ATP-grasp superfamily ATP-dependent carboligase
VVAADLFADADLERVCPVTRITNYPEGLADWLAGTPCDGWLYTGALENHPELVDRMAELRPLLGNRGEVLRRVRDPLALQETLKAVGLNFPETKPCDGTSPGKGEWLHKTGQGASGSGVQRSDDPLSQANAPPGQAWRLASGYWQREIKGMPGSAQYLAGGDSTCTLLGITRQLVGEAWTGAAEFQYCGTLAPWDLPMHASADLTHAGQVLTTQFQLCGLFGVDFIFDGKGVWIIEVNPRVTAAVEAMDLASEFNLLSFHLREFELGHVTYQERSPNAGKTILYAKQPLVVSRRLSEQLLTVAGDINRPRLADIPHAGTQISCGEPILTVLAEGNDLAAVEADLRQRVADLEVQLYRDSGGS